ncbi:MAG: hypothetical protein H6641_20450 [Caldilineaceae bacterium]|nr:hypothetical protein [Caldilineaceae bacterium]
MAGVIYYTFGAKELVDNPWNLHILSPAIAALAGATLLGLFRFFNNQKRPLLGALSTPRHYCTSADRLAIEHALHSLAPVRIPAGPGRHCGSRSLATW